MGNPDVNSKGATDTDNSNPNNFIINPVLAIHTQVDDLTIEVDELKKIADEHTQLLSPILDTVKAILKEQKDRRPVGKVFRRRDTARIDEFYIIDSNKIPGDGHKFRSYFVINEGPNNIYVGFNVAKSPQLDASIEDLLSDEQRFDYLTPGQSTNDAFDTEEIASLHIIADPATGLGSSIFKAKLLW